MDNGDSSSFGGDFGHFVGSGAAVSTVPDVPALIRDSGDWRYRIESGEEQLRKEQEPHFERARVAAARIEEKCTAAKNRT